MAKNLSGRLNDRDEDETNNEVTQEPEKVTTTKNADSGTDEYKFQEEGRKKKEEKKKNKIMKGIYFDDDVLKALDKAVKGENSKQSTIVNEMVRKGLEKLGYLK